LAKTSTSCATFRLSSEKLNRLRKVSEDKNITPNTLVSQLVKAHVNWHSMAAHAKLYYLPKSFLIKLVNELTEEELIVLALETAKNDLVDISLFLRGGFTIASLSDITETWLRISQMPYRYEINEDSCKIIIENEHGIEVFEFYPQISRYSSHSSSKMSTCKIT